jgi:phage baseplate assembly protein W
MATTNIKLGTVYTDIRGDMSVNPANDDLLLNKNENAIQNSIVNLLTTNFYERPFQPDIGSNVMGLLFELDTPQTVYNLREAITNTIQAYEPRCQLIDVIVESDSDRNQYNVEISYYITNAEAPQIFNTILKRVR